MDQEEYNKEFEGDGQAVPDSVRVRALDRALDIRKFEIDLYWKEL